MLIPFPRPLLAGRLVRRYKRFLADVMLEDGRELTVHCPNTGSMKNCGGPGSRVWIDLHQRPGRKLPGTWELVETAPGELACVHSARANAIMAAGLEAGLITPLGDYPGIRREVCLTAGASRFDFLLSNAHASCVVEVKSVTLGLGGGAGAFPDAVSLRGQKHLRELISLVEAGQPGCLLFCVMHSGIDRVRAAVEIDPVYAELLRRARAAGVLVLAWSVRPSPLGMELVGELPVEC